MILYKSLHSKRAIRIQLSRGKLIGPNTIHGILLPAHSDDWGTKPLRFLETNTIDIIWLNFPSPMAIKSLHHAQSSRQNDAIEKFSSFHQLLTQRGWFFNVQSIKTHLLNAPLNWYQSKSDTISKTTHNNLLSCPFSSEMGFYFSPDTKKQKKKSNSKYQIFQSITKACHCLLYTHIKIMIYGFLWISSLLFENRRQSKFTEKFVFWCGNVFFFPKKTQIKILPC